MLDKLLQLVMLEKKLHNFFIRKKKGKRGLMHCTPQEFLHYKSQNPSTCNPKEIAVGFFKFKPFISFSLYTFGNIEKFW